MGILLKLSAFAVRIACNTTGVPGLPEIGQAVTDYLVERFTNHSSRLTEALQRANEKAWNTLEFSLAGDSQIGKLAGADDKAFREQVRSFLAAIHVEYPEDGGPNFREHCLEELRSARDAGLLDSGGLTPQDLAQEAGQFVQFTSPTDTLEAQRRALEQISDFFSPAQYPHLNRLLKYRSRNGFSVLTAAVSYFFRREVVTNPELFNEAIFSEVGQIREEQDEHFMRLGNRLEEALDRIDALNKRVAQIVAAISELTEAFQLKRRTLTPRDSIALNDERDRDAITRLVKQYRALPSEQRHRRPDVLSEIGKLQAVSGDYDGAESVFQEITGLVNEPAAKAEAFANAYQVALEKRDWPTALQHLQEAIKIDPGRFAPFPTHYTPERILGAGGFGVAFLCHDSTLDRHVVVKTLLLDNSDRDAEAFLREAKLLLRVEDPNVIKLLHCGYADQNAQSRPYLVMEYFENSATLEAHVASNGPFAPLAVEDFLKVARRIADALKKAHAQGIHHRDVKPANILVRRNGSEWEVKLIDFGLALKQGSTREISGVSGRTVLGAAIAGTLEYAAPEQLGRLPGVQPGRPADIYSFAKTCCYALFKTTQPMSKHWAQIRPQLKELLESSLSENPNERPQDFGVVITEITEAPAPPGNRDRILEHFQTRLSASISKSSLLKIPTGKSSRILDVSRLAVLGSEVPSQLLKCIIGGAGKQNLDLRSLPTQNDLSRNGTAEANTPDRLYDLLNGKIRSRGELAKRETGVHALWIGYPLLYASTGNREADRWILAPVFLWPIVIDREARSERHLGIGRATDPEAARFNRAMAHWVHRELEFTLKNPDDELTAPDLAGWREQLKSLDSRFGTERMFDFDTPLQALPDRQSLQGGLDVVGPTFRVLHAAALGYFRWPNEAILEDLGSIREEEGLRRVVDGFVSTAKLPQPSEEKSPTVADRYLVFDADFSQERVVWQARTGPGLVVHGPPGTGKSQTIVNVIADTLAHNQTVLMVCQKQAATRVVLERLRAVGLADLVLEIHDVESKRQEVFQEIRNQVESLGAAPTGQCQQERSKLVEEIDLLETELDEYARAFHEPHLRHGGLSYRDMKALEWEQKRAFPTLRQYAPLQRILGGLSRQTVEALTRKVRLVGCWHAEGDPLHNPWRFGRLTEFQRTFDLRADVHRALAQLRALDATHIEHVHRHPSTCEIKADLLTFLETAPDLLSRLRPLVTAPRSLILDWLRELRKRSVEKRQALFDHAEMVMDLARQVQASTRDSHWEEIARNTTNFTATAQDLKDRLEILINERKADGVCLTERWLAALCRHPAELAQYRERCAGATQLAGQVATLTPDSDWEAVRQSVPDYERIVNRVTQRIKKWVTDENQTERQLVGAWLRIIRGASEATIEDFKEKCGQSIKLATQLDADRDAKAEERRPIQEIANFANRSSQFLDRLSSLRATALPPRDLMAHCWLRFLYRGDEAEQQARMENCNKKCREAVELSEEASAAARYPEWDAVCGGWTIAQLEDLQLQADEFLRQIGKFWAVISPAYLRAKSALRKLRPDVPSDFLALEVAVLSRYIRSRVKRDRSLALNNCLVPDYPASDEELSHPSFAKLAEEAFHEAVDLVELGKQDPMYTAALVEFYSQDGGIGPAENALKTMTDRANRWKRLEEMNQRLIPDISRRLTRFRAKDHRIYPRIALSALVEAIKLERERQDWPWLDLILNAFTHKEGDDRLESIKRWETHLETRALCQRLTEINRKLIPGHEPPHDEATLAVYGTQATEALEQAAALCQLREQHPWAAPIVDEVALGSHSTQYLSFSRLEAYLRSRESLESLIRENKHLLPGWNPPRNEADQVQFAETVCTSLKEAKYLQERESAQPWIRSLLDAFLSPKDPAHPARALAEFEQTVTRYRIVKEIWDTLLSLERYLEEEAIREPRDESKAGRTVTPWADRLEKGLDGLQALIQLHSERQHRSGAEGEVLKILEDYEQKRSTEKAHPQPPPDLSPDNYGDWWVALLNYSAAVEWQENCQADFPILTRLTPEVHAEKIRRLKEALARKRSLEPQIIREKWLVEQQRHFHEVWTRMLQSKMRLRQAVSENWHTGLRTLRPCWLVSPDAASQLFPLNPRLFDLVLFDEASQCPLEQAIPAIYRGKRLVVSGDEKQLPPTAFFSAGLELDEEEVNEDDPEADDDPAEAQRRLERLAEEEALKNCTDLLQAAIGKLKQLYLHVHYRSESPALIEFSNRAFYRGQLEVPPDRKVLIEGEGPIEYHATNGTYCDRTNPDEARRVVDLLKKIWAAPGEKPTLGVVTFNQAQRDLIDKQIEQEGSNDELFNAYYRTERDRKEGNQDVGFFVKNLENVQGDEREVMIFSTTFGKDQQGRFNRRFGPVAMAGGHRRLNVAVTRAKRRIIIVGSMPIEKIADASAEAPGRRTPAGYLKLYLKYAYALSTGNDEEVRRILDSLSRPSDPEKRGFAEETPLEADVRAVLTQLGYKVIRGVGGSGFSIDLGVLHPEGKQVYVLGIICDGGARYDGRSSRIREVWRRGLLERRGWNLHDIWSYSWWNHRDAEVRKLTASLSKIIAKEKTGGVRAGQMEIHFKT